MPARKPKNLIVRHETAAERQARAEQESAMTPARGLPQAAPAALADHPVAQAAWRRMMRTYGEVEGQIVTRLDLDLLVDYCLLAEQLAELDLMRKTTYRMWLELGQGQDRATQAAKRAREKAKAAAREARAAGEEDDGAEDAWLKESAHEEDRAVEMAAKCLNAFEAVVKLDGRADRKRDLLFKLRQSLYLTPRARAGVAPEKREQEPEKDPLEMLLDDVTGFVNGAGDEA